MNIPFDDSIERFLADHFKNGSVFSFTKDLFNLDLVESFKTEEDSELYLILNLQIAKNYYILFIKQDRDDINQMVELKLICLNTTNRNYAGALLRGVQIYNEFEGHTELSKRLPFYLDLFV